MPPKTIKKALADMLEDLSKQDFDKFCHALLDRRGETRVRRNRVENKSFLEITDVLVSSFTEVGALEVAVELLKQIDCNGEATSLVEETRGQCPKPAPNDIVKMGEQPGPSGDEHFVDKHKVKLTQRVSNIAPILDDLLDRKALQQETYDRIRALATTQDKMRELYSGPLKASTACKNIFYEILKEHEPYLIADLNGGK